MAISDSLFERVVLELCRLSAVELPAPVLEKLRSMYAEETNPIAKRQFEAILKNCEIAKEKRIAICQDNGLHEIFLEFGQRVQMDGDFEAAAKRALSAATKEIPLRENAIHPLSKKNSGTNVEVHIPTMHWSPLPDADYLDVTVVPKGNGAEMRDGHCWILTSEDIKKAAVRVALDAVSDMMGEPCPPIILGIGIGGHFESNAALAKKALFREPIGSHNPDPMAAELEQEIFEAVNNLKLGPMGFGGDHYAMAVHIEISGAHTAIVPITVSAECWAHRYSKARIHNDGRVEFITHPHGRLS